MKTLRRALVVAALSIPAARPAAQKAAAGAKTPWGEPDLQGIWTSEYEIPLQRAAKYKDREFFTDAEIAEFDRVRAAIQRREYRDKDAAGKGTEQDVAGAEKIAKGDSPSGVSRAEWAAWISIARVLLNLDEFITRE